MKILLQRFLYSNIKVKRVVHRALFNSISVESMECYNEDA